MKARVWAGVPIDIGIPRLSVWSLRVRLRMGIWIGLSECDAHVAWDEDVDADADVEEEEEDAAEADDAAAVAASANLSNKGSVHSTRNVLHCRSIFLPTQKNEIYI